MSQVNAAAEQAYGTIVTQLAAPYFFEKLASHGIQPRNEKEAAEMWDAASKLHMLWTAEQEKAAAARANDMTALNAQLDSMLAAAGLGGAPVVPEKSAAFKQAAVVAAGQPDIAKAVLTLQAAAAAELQNAE